MKKVGDIVRYWFDTGAMGYSILYGRVMKAGPVVFYVTWESGNRNRIAQSNRDVTLVPPDELAYATAAMRKAGL